jgi:hypothetical protein
MRAGAGVGRYLPKDHPGLARLGVASSNRLKERRAIKNADRRKIMGPDRQAFCRRLEPLLAMLAASDLVEFLSQIHRCAPSQLATIRA